MNTGVEDMGNDGDVNGSPPCAVEVEEAGITQRPASSVANPNSALMKTLEPRPSGTCTSSKVSADETRADGTPMSVCSNRSFRFASSELFKPLDSLRAGRTAVAVTLFWSETTADLATNFSAAVCSDVANLSVVC